MSRDDDTARHEAEGESESDETGTDTPTWGDLFARGEAVGTTETAVRETLRSRRDD